MKVNADGSLHLRARLVIPASEIQLRVTTSGGPGGQHANRSLTKVIASFDVVSSNVLSDGERDLLVERLGTEVRASSSRFRSQSANRAAALESLALKLHSGMLRQTPRRPTRPTRASQTRRVDEKKARSRIKQTRRGLED
ncbi:MAG: aminoacyl-tRNA hydrolase [Acidimicrobiaceae bacterium]|nr:aminoacyl-tRNA hydrolase [Acidimicrobiaceae bacterium]